jgi:hypothetical protein
VENAASLIRDRYILGVRYDPGSAAHHFMLRRAREKLWLPLVRKTVAAGADIGFCALHA